MKAVSACAECLVRLAGTTADAAGADQKTRLECVRAALKILVHDRFDRPPPEIAFDILEQVYKVLENPDPFKDIKSDCNKAGLEVSRKMAKSLEGLAGDQRLEAAIRLAVCGNLIDFATMGEIDIENDAPALIEQPFSIMQLDELLAALGNAASILFLADNAGEIAFDRFLIQELLDRGKQLTIALKTGPALNDALLEDAIEVGLDTLEGPAGRVRLISTGTARMGVKLEDSSPEFLDAIESSDFILAKGQANLETLLGSGLNIFFLSLVKCAPLAGMVGVDEASAILLWERSGHGIDKS